MISQTWQLVLDDVASVQINPVTAKNKSYQL